jgi:hypothetical protein
MNIANHYLIQIQLNLIHVQQSIVTKTKKIIQQQELDLQTLQQVKQKTVTANNRLKTNEMIGLNDKIIQLQNQLIQNQNTVLFALKEIKNCYRKIETIYMKLM